MPKKSSKQREERLARREARRQKNGRGRQGNVVPLNPEVQLVHGSLTEPKVLKTTFTPKKPAQAVYAQLIDSCDVVFGTGAAGTGKSHVATAKAAVAMIEERTQGIVITRPVVEAKGEGAGLGFLPGTANEKCEPYLAPIREILLQYFTASHLDYLIETKRIEFVPFEHMRGHTYSNRYIIVDEAQNVTPGQMKLVLTRMGHFSKVIVNGDTNQSDLPMGVESGLMDAVRRFGHRAGFGHHHFTTEDIVRNDIVRTIIECYEGIEEESAIDVAETA